MKAAVEPMGDRLLDYSISLLTLTAFSVIMSRLLTRLSTYDIYSD